MTIYRIADWDAHFENNRTRELKYLNYVPIPNKMDGDGYTELLDHDDGASHFGAWCAIIQIASRCTPRGTLVRHIGTIPQGGAMPHTSATLARISRINRSVFDSAIPRLISIGWLEDINITDNELREMSQQSRAFPHPPAEKRLSPSPSPSPSPTPNKTHQNGRPKTAREYTKDVQDAMDQP